MYTQVEKYTPPLELPLALLYCDIFSTFSMGFLYLAQSADRKTDLSNQDLYELVQDFHTATLQSSEVAQKTRPLVSLLKEGYAKDAKRYRIARNASGAIFGLLSAMAVLGIWNPVGWVAFGACACGGLVGAYGGVRVYGRFDKEGGRASNKERSVKACESPFSVRKLRRCIVTCYVAHACI